MATEEMNLSGGDRRNIVNRLAVKQNGIQIEQTKQVRQNFWQDIADAIASVFADKLFSPSLNQTSEHANAIT